MPYQSQAPSSHCQPGLGASQQECLSAAQDTAGHTAQAGLQGAGSLLGPRLPSQPNCPPALRPPASSRQTAITPLPLNNCDTDEFTPLYTLHQRSLRARLHDLPQLFLSTGKNPTHLFSQLNITCFQSKVRPRSSSMSIQPGTFQAEIPERRQSCFR